MKIYIVIELVIKKMTYSKNNTILHRSIEHKTKILKNK